MENWKNYKYYSFLTPEDRENIKTARQWALLGYVPIDPASGSFMYSNRFCVAAYDYYSIDEVRKGTKEELQAFFAPETEKRKRKAAEAKEKRNRYKPLRDYRKRCKKAADKVPFYPDKLTRSIVIDTETTGLYASENEILQLSIIDAETGKTLFNKYLKPYQLTSWERAERVNHISPRKVAKKPLLEEYIDKIQGILNEAEEIIGYNVDFDLSFLEASGFNLSHVQHAVDVMEAYAEGHNSGSWVKLTDCASAFGYDWESSKAHDSLGDCKATLYCYNAMYKPNN